MIGCRILVVGVCVLAAGCSGSDSPTDPSPSNPRLTAPAAESPGDQEQLGTLRPTLTVRNGTSDQSGARTYEFQISDRTDFSAVSGSAAGFFAVVVNGTGVPEGSDGRTSYTVTQDLQPTTRFYWRARLVQGAARSDWSPSRTFKSKLVGYSQPGELYDPLIHSETIGTAIGSTTFIAGKGIRLNDQNSYVRYQLQQTIPAGEFSVEVEGLHPNGSGEKLRIFSMMDSTGNLFNSRFLLNVQYRGLNGNPPNCIAFKALFGGEHAKLEPDIAVRTASVRSLDPSRTYHWKATWSNEFRLVVEDGIGGPTIYNQGISSGGAIYSPPSHYAYLGANNGPFGQEAGSWPGAIYRNVWIANRPRPASLGSALRPQ
jgi:hypothetical protein